MALALACDTGIGTMVTSIGTMVTSTCQRDTAITMTIAITTIAMTIAAKISTAHRRPIEVSNSIQIWEAPGAKL